MKSQANSNEAIDMHQIPYEEPPSFGQRLQQIRKQLGLSQTEFGEILGICKQQLSRYERDERSPKVKTAKEYAAKLGMTVGEIYGDGSADIIDGFWKRKEGKPFYQIFEDIIYGQLGLSVEEVVVFTGLSEAKLRHIVSYKMQVAPLELAMILESTLNIPVEVWAGRCEYTPSDISVYGFQLARAYMQLDEPYKAIVSTVLHNTRA